MGGMPWIYIGSRREKQFNSEQILIMLFGVLYDTQCLGSEKLGALYSYITYIHIP